MTISLRLPVYQNHKLQVMLYMKSGLLISVVRVSKVKGRLLDLQYVDKMTWLCLIPWSGKALLSNTLSDSTF